MFFPHMTNFSVVAQDADLIAVNKFPQFYPLFDTEMIKASTATASLPFFKNHQTFDVTGGGAKGPKYTNMKASASIPSDQYFIATHLGIALLDTVSADTSGDLLEEDLIAMLHRGYLKVKIEETEKLHQPAWMWECPLGPVIRSTIDGAAAETRLTTAHNGAVGSGIQPLITPLKLPGEKIFSIEWTFGESITLAADHYAVCVLGGFLARKAAA